MEKKELLTAQAKSDNVTNWAEQNSDYRLPNNPFPDSVFSVRVDEIEMQKFKREVPYQRI